VCLKEQYEMPVQLLKLKRESWWFNLQVPVEVSGFRATNLSLRWIIRYADQRVGRSMSIKLANEIIDS
jgi:ribosomal protein S7